VDPHAKNDISAGMADLCAGPTNFRLNLISRPQQFPICSKHGAMPVRKSLSKVKQALQHSAAELASPIAHHDAETNGCKSEEEKDLKREQRIEEKEEAETKTQQTKYDNEEELRLARMRSDAMAEQVEPVEMRERYGMVNMDFNESLERVDIASLSLEDVGNEVLIRTRIQTIRKMGSNLAFLLLRQQTTTIQGVFAGGGSSHIDTYGPLGRTSPSRINCFGQRDCTESHNRDH